MLEKLLQQVAVLLAQPAAIPFVLAFAGGFFAFHIRDRRRMLAFKALVDGLYAIHFIMMSAYAGAFGCLIAVCGLMMQVLTPDRLMQRTLFYRNIVAACLAVLGAFIIAQHSADLLPMFGCAIARFVEIQRDPQRIRLGMAGVLLLWMAYAWEKELYLMLVAHITVWISLLLAYRKHKIQAVTP